MIAITFRFTSGGFHATPWGRHVNEGVPEWPPSPWRILRALVSARYCTLPPNTPERDLTAVLASMLSKLADTPDFELPRATTAHSRHYMPWYKKGPGDRTLIFDTFVALDRDQPVIAVWPNATLREDERSLLGSLLENLPYLGRAESWCRAELYSGGARPNCRPLDGGAENLDVEPVRVLVPDTSDPEVLLQALTVDVGNLRRGERRRDPPFSRWESYGRPRACFEPQPKVGAVPLRRGSEPITVARYAIDAKPLPALTEAVSVAELARRACLALYGRQNDRGVSAILAGKDEESNPLLGHQHAFYLPTDEDQDGRIDHLTIVAAKGFNDQERQVLGSLSTLAQGEGRPELWLLLLGLGPTSDFVRWAPALASARTWQSVTPFVLSRHPKVTRAGAVKVTREGWQVDGAEDQVWREWEHRRALDPMLPALTAVKRLPACVLRGHKIRWMEFRRWRERSGRSTLGTGLGFTLTFEREVPGPVALGYGCHFGLGQFVAAGV